MVAVYQLDVNYRCVGNFYVNHQQFVALWQFDVGIFIGTYSGENHIYQC